MKLKGRAAVLTGVPLVACGLGACSDVDRELFEVNRPKSHADAGSIHLAVAPPIPFERVREALRPTYTLSGDDAYKAAIPNTAYMEDLFFR